jgi:hypothetical protein
MITGLITGFPRSGLAWVANYLYHGSTVVVFDALAQGKDEPNFHFLTEYEQRGNNVVLVDHSIPAFQDMLKERFPDAKWVIIERNPRDSKRSIEKLGIKPGNALAPLSAKIEEIRLKFNPLRVKFEDLTSSMEDIINFLGLESIAHHRHEMLQHFNVEFDFKTGVEELAKVQASPLLNRRAEPPAPTPANAEAIGVLAEICQENPLAYKFLVQSVETALVWDHAVDGDLIDTESTNRAFENLLTEWPNNQFIRDHARSLTPVMASSISKWKNGDRDAHYAVYADLATAVAFILGGMPHVNKHIPKLRQLIPTLIAEDDRRDGNA